MWIIFSVYWEEASQRTFITFIFFGGVETTDQFRKAIPKVSQKNLKGFDHDLTAASDGNFLWGKHPAAPAARPAIFRQVNC